MGYVLIALPAFLPSVILSSKTPPLDPCLETFIVFLQPVIYFTES